MLKATLKEFLDELLTNTWRSFDELKELGRNSGGNPVKYLEELKRNFRKNYGKLRKP